MEADACSEKHAVLAVTVLMAGLWVVGTPHSAVVAMFPVIILPMLGVGGHKYGLENQYFNKVPAPQGIFELLKHVGETAYV